LENLESGDTIGEFIQWLPGVSQQQFLEVLTTAEKSLGLKLLGVVVLARIPIHA